MILLESCAIILSIILFIIFYFFVFARQCDVRYYSENSSVLDKFNRYYANSTTTKANHNNIVRYQYNIIELNTNEDTIETRNPDYILWFSGNLFREIPEIIRYHLPPTLYDIFSEKYYLYRDSARKKIRKTW